MIDLDMFLFLFTCMIPLPWNAGKVIPSKGFQNGNDYDLF